MAVSHLDTAFAGSVPQVYERYMVPLIFEPYARDIAERAARCQPTRVLEVAAGTGVVTRALCRLLTSDVAITASDLNQPMLDHAASVGTSRAIEWRQADVMHLPFTDRSFDLVVCQFGAMFFPDKPRAFSEVVRVLRPGGTFLFDVWDRIEHNELADSVDRAVEALFPDDPPRFMASVPHGYSDLAAIARDLASGGFPRTPEAITVAERSRTDSARSAAVAFCQGTPLRGMLESRGPVALAEATDAATRAITERFGPGAIDAKMQAHIVSIQV